jgi:hypothetical protein
MNLALNGLESDLRRSLPIRRGNVQTKVHVIRFADDFVRHEACVVHGV